MVKGISRQVIVVHAPEPKLFEQAIFILKEEAVGQGITDEALLKEAQDVIRGSDIHRKKQWSACMGMLCALGGSILTAAVWYLITVM